MPRIGLHVKVGSLDIVSSVVKVDTRQFHT